MICCVETFHKGPYSFSLKIHNVTSTENHEWDLSQTSSGHFDCKDYTGHPFGVRIAEVCAAYFYGTTTLESIPSKLFETFVNIFTLTAENVGLEKVNRGDFQFASNLKLLSMADNEIETIQAACEQYVTLFLHQI